MIRLSIEEGKLCCFHPIREHGWTIAIGDIVLIAEYTTDEGPQQDDYFLVFITREQGELYYSTVSMYAAGMEGSLRELEAILGGSLDLALSSSTTWNSRVVWPPELAGSPYFRYEEAVPEGLWDKLRSTVRGKRIESHLADHIADHLASLIQPSGNPESTDENA